MKLVLDYKRQVVSRYKIKIAQLFTIEILINEKNLCANYRLMIGKNHSNKSCHSKVCDNSKQGKFIPVAHSCNVSLLF